MAYVALPIQHIWSYQYRVALVLVMGGRDPVGKMLMKFYRDPFSLLVAAQIHKWGLFVRIKKSLSTQRWVETNLTPAQTQAGKDGTEQP